MTHFTRFLLLLALGLAPRLAHAGEPPSLPLDGSWVPLSEAALEEMRGGFALPSGMELSFGFQRVVEINGQLVAQTRLQIADIARLTPTDVEALTALNTGMVIQVGNGNTFTPGDGGAGLVIQNTLSNQDIRVATTVDVSVGSLDLFQNLNSNSALQSALIGAPGSL